MCVQRHSEVRAAFFTRFFVLLAGFVIGLSTTFAGDTGAGDVAANRDETAAERGYRILRTKPFLPADFDDEVFADLWMSWPEPLRTQAAQADLATRSRMIFEHYGMVQPTDGDTKRALGYTHDGRGGWVMNCFHCHAGTVNGNTIPGAPNSRVALQTLTEDVTATKIRLQKPLSHLDLAQIRVPLGSTVGTTNSVMFGVLLSNVRDLDMRVDTNQSAPPLVHHDMDAPPWWNVRKKSMLYIDGHSPKTHRPLTQFMLLPVNDAATVKSWENDFRDILAYIESLQPPRWPFAVDKKLAAQGQQIFNEHCSECHGTYGENASWPERLVPWEQIRTDPVRLRALPEKHMRWMRDGWMSRYGKDKVVMQPKGYVAPPLDGIWASAPYFHNGSVPTLWHVLHPEQRPSVWQRRDETYNQAEVGLNINTFKALPRGLSPAERRHYFDTGKPGKSGAGHLFPEKLSDAQKRAVLEYLKTL